MKSWATLAASLYFVLLADLIFLRLAGGGIAERDDAPDDGAGIETRSDFSVDGKPSTVSSGCDDASDRVARVLSAGKRCGSR